MEVVKFVRSEEKGGFRKLYFELCDRLADYIHHWTEYEDEKLVRYLNEDNLFRYTISNTEGFDSIQKSEGMKLHMNCSWISLLGKWVIHFYICILMKRKQVTV